MRRWPQALVGAAIAIAHLVPVIPEGYSVCDYRAANVRHANVTDQDYRGPGVKFTAGDIVKKYSIGRQNYECTVSLEASYGPDSPDNNYLRNLREGDVVHERKLVMYSLTDILNDVTGNKKGHELCYPKTCPPVTLKFEGVNGAGVARGVDEHGIMKVLWTK